MVKGIKCGKRKEKRSNEHDIFSGQERQNIYISTTATVLILLRGISVVSLSLYFPAGLQAKPLVVHP